MDQKELKPGRELDALIAEKVMGLRYYPPGNSATCIVETPGWYSPGQSRVVESLPAYSTSIAAAWEVVEKLTGSGDCTFQMARNTVLPKEHRKDDPGTWARFEVMFGYAGGRGARAEAATAPHSICLAALKAIGHS